jgi:6-phosphogluconate dehydrogenase
MQLGIIGLGRMGGNIARRLMRRGHQVVVFGRNAAAVEAIAREGATPTLALDDFVTRLKPPRAVWVMLPAGAATEEMVERLAGVLSRGDIIVDGGNSYFKDDIRRAERLRPTGIVYLDVGTSGGVWGLERGYCMMIGGDAAAVERLDPIFAALAPGAGSIARTPKREARNPRAEQGYLHCGPSGAGHFVKMIHNGIEYGMMQAFAEGFDIMRHAGDATLPEVQRYRLDLADIAELWRRGSVISSWLLDLTAAALVQDAELAGYTGFVEDSGEGRWTVMTAIEEAVPANVLSAALYARFRSRMEQGFGDKLLSAMRHQFGGHVEGQGGKRG